MISLITPAKAETAMHLRCTICKEWIEICDSCSRKFAVEDQLLHVTNNILNFHFCSEKCRQDFADFNDILMGAPA